jgi:hypothetical protein
LPLKGSGEQGGQQLDRLRFLSSGKRLDPHRAEPDLTVIDCLGAQRHNLAAAAWRIVIVHWLSTPAEEPDINGAPAQTDTPGRGHVEGKCPST